MLATFLIMLREGIEAALIVGIIAGYLRRTGRAAWLPLVWLGVFMAVAASLAVGAGLQLASAEFPERAQALFESAVALVAVAVLVSMVFWMRRAARSIKSGLQDSVEAALGGSAAPGWALVGTVFFAVAREGVESAFFLLASFEQSRGTESSGTGILIGALAGVGVAVVVGCLIYLGGLRIDLRRFFRWTGVFILVVAAGLLASVPGSLHEAGVWNLLQERVYDLSGVVPESSALGAVLAGVFNFKPAPSLGAVILYTCFLAATLTLFLRPSTPAAGASGGQSNASA